MRQHPANQTATHQSGFNLVELMVVIAIASILLTIGVPAFNSFFKALRDDQVVGGLKEAMALARSEAIKSGRDAVVCAGASSCNDSTDWSGGWLVALESVGGANSEVLQVWSAAPNGYQVDAVDEIRFKASGEIAAGINQTIEVIQAEGNNCLNIGILGHVSAVEGGC